MCCSWKKSWKRPAESYIHNGSARSLQAVLVILVRMHGKRHKERQINITYLNTHVRLNLTLQSPILL